MKQTHNIIIISLLDPIKNLPLHAVLQLTPPHHQMKDLVNGVFWVFLFREEENLSECCNCTLTVKNSDVKS